MNTRKTPSFLRRLSALLAALLMLTFPALAEETVSGQSNTLATVTFMDGELTLGGKMQGSGLNFNFGEHVIPVTEASYPADNYIEGAPVAHVLPVEDSRFASGSWQVTASMTAFTDHPTTPTGTFDALVRMENPVIANENTSAGTSGLTATGTVTISSTGSAVPVLTADDTLKRGNYSATWTNEDVTLNISDSEVINIGPIGYYATLTWTLSIGPF